MWHIGTFLVINAFFWLLDIVTGADGVQWAYWITIFCGLAMAFHVVTYVVGGSGLEERKHQKSLVDEQQQDHESFRHNRWSQRDRKRPHRGRRSRTPNRQRVRLIASVWDTRGCDMGG